MRHGKQDLLKQPFILYTHNPVCFTQSADYESQKYRKFSPLSLKESCSFDNHLTLFFYQGMQQGPETDHHGNVLNI